MTLNFQGEELKIQMRKKKCGNDAFLLDAHYSSSFKFQMGYKGSMPLEIDVYLILDDFNHFPKNYISVVGQIT